MIGLVPQELQLEAFEKVFQNVSYTRGLYGKRANPEIIEKILIFWHQLAFYRG